MINIVYDVDDVLNNLNSYVFNKLGLPMPTMYELSHCSNYTDEQRESILSLYRNPKTFQSLSYVPGASDICNIEKSNKARVWINSNNLSTEIAEIKKSSLMDNIPSLSIERVVMRIITSHDPIKQIISDTDIIVEDSLLNLTKYSDKVCKILIDKPYNKSETYGFTDKSLKIYRVNNLIGANNLIWRILNHGNKDKLRSIS